MWSDRRYLSIGLQPKGHDLVTSGTAAYVRELCSFPRGGTMHRPTYVVPRLIGAGLVAILSLGFFPRAASGQG